MPWMTQIQAYWTWQFQFLQKDRNFLPCDKIGIWVKNERLFPSKEFDMKRDFRLNYNIYVILFARCHNSNITRESYCMPWRQSA